MTHSISQYRPLPPVVASSEMRLTSLEARCAALEATLAQPLATYQVDHTTGLPITPSIKSPLVNDSTPVWQVPSSRQKYTHINAAGSFTLHTVPCVIFGYTINSAAAKATFNIRNGVDTTGDLIAQIDATATPGSVIFPGGGIYCPNGLFVNVFSTPDITIVSGQ